MSVGSSQLEDAQTVHITYTGTHVKQKALRLAMRAPYSSFDDKTKYEWIGGRALLFFYNRCTIELLFYWYFLYS